MIGFVWFVMIGKLYILGFVRIVCDCGMRESLSEIDFIGYS